VAQDACAHRHRPMQMLPLHKRIVGVAFQTQLLGRVGAQQEMKLALMWIVAIQTAALLDRLVDVVLDRQEVTNLTQGFFRIAEMELMRVGLRLGVARIAHPAGHRLVEHRLDLQIRMTTKIGARLAFHLGRQRDGSSHKRRKQKQTRSTDHRRINTALSSSSASLMSAR